MPPKDTDLNKTVFMAENGEDYDVIGGFTDINVISSSQSTLDNIMEEHIAAVNKAFIKLSNAIREFTVTINMQNGKIAEVYFPKYLMTEWRFPKKKKRGTMRRMRREKRRVA